MNTFKRVLVFSLVLTILTLDAAVLFSAGKYSTVRGKVVGYRGAFKRYLEIEKEPNKVIVDFRVGKNTVYSPRAPSPGERVKVEYLAPEGTPIAYRVTILD